MKKKMTYAKYDEEDEVKGETNVSIIMTRKLKEKLDYLSTDYTKSEIAGFLTYSKIEQNTDGDVQIVLDNLLIPPQKASHSEVDVDGEGQVAMWKEYGKELMGKVIGQWHSHHTMGAFFSGTDETMMKSYSENKTFRVFIVSSKGEHLIRLVLRNSINEIPFEMKIENVDYGVESDDTIKIEMEEEIKKKVIEEPIVTTKITYSSSSKSETKKLKKEIETRVRYYQHQNHKVKIEKVFKEYADMICEEFKTLNPVIEKAEIDDEHFNVIVELGDKNKAKEFMVDVKAFLLMVLSDEIKREKEEKEAETGIQVIRGEELEDYLSEEDLQEMEEEEEYERRYGSHSNYDSTYSGRCNWTNHRDRETMNEREMFNRKGYLDYAF